MHARQFQGAEAVPAYSNMFDIFTHVKRGPSLLAQLGTYRSSTVYNQVVTILLLQHLLSQTCTLPCMLLCQCEANLSDPALAVESESMHTTL